jgi:hypothetical protein
MADNMKIERNIDDDGRRVETRVYETVIDGQKQRVIETHIEQIPMTLAERVVEKVSPIVTTRKTELYRDGKIVDAVLEELDHGTLRMGTVVQAPAHPKESDVLTKNDLKEILREILQERDSSIREVKPTKKVVNKTKKVEPEPVEEVEEIEEIEDAEVTPSKDNNKVWEWVEIGAYVVLSGELAFCLYHLLLKNWL